MITPEGLGMAAGFATVRWRDAALPPGVPALVDEAVGSGVAWMADFPETWRARPFLDAGEGLFLALAGGRPAAMAVLSADNFTAVPGTGRLRYIYVGAAARGRGLLRAFVEAALQRAAPRWRRLRLHTDNPVAARLYEAYGFKPTSDEPRSTHVREDG